ncbi:hypothetical protein IWZ03DRAFT_75300 [Phyllosticta citriasiana]|uniref:Uncharacterized protein n=1 Tax=Phyllosticta citriasiana TaxID=595635 RepID=A0ABR1KBW7_9PEZI
MIWRRIKHAALLARSLANLLHFLFFCIFLFLKNPKLQNREINKKRVLLWDETLQLLPSFRSLVRQRQRRPASQPRRHKHDSHSPTRRNAATTDACTPQANQPARHARPLVQCLRAASCPRRRRAGQCQARERPLVVLRWGRLWVERRMKAWRRRQILRSGGGRSSACPFGLVSSGTAALSFSRLSFSPLLLFPTLRMDPAPDPNLRLGAVASSSS